MALAIIRADYADHAQGQQQIIDLLNLYARDPMDDGRPLGVRTRARVVGGLAAMMPTAFWLIAYVADRTSRLSQLLLRFFDFSGSAAGQSALSHRRTALTWQGVTRILFAERESTTVTHACKVTLSVLSGNATARSLTPSSAMAIIRLVTKPGRHCSGRKDWQQHDQGN